VGHVDDVTQTGIPWLTDPQRDFLAHLLVVTLLPQMQEAHPDKGYTYRRIADALGEIAEEGQMDLRADDENVWVFISGESIVHAARDWLEWMTPRWTASQSN
jgi:hypothetical protein